MKETFTLYSSTGQPIVDVTVDFYRPHMDLLILPNRVRPGENRYFTWRETELQYREVMGAVVWSHGDGRGDTDD